MLGHQIAGVKKDTSISLVQVMKKVMTLNNRRECGRAEPPKFTLNSSKF